MDTLYKNYKAVIKEVDAAKGEIEMMIPLSSNEIDRDGEVIEPQAFKKVIPKFMKHPVLVASHNYGDLVNQIGEWTKLKITENGLEGRPKYYVDMGNPQADWAFKLASMGKAAFSVGFIPDPDGIEEGDGKKTPRRTYKNISDLLEISQCIIPSNRSAIQTIRAKSVGDKVITELCDAVEKDIPKDGVIINFTQPTFLDNENQINKLVDKLQNVVTKPEVTDEYIRIPVSEGHDGDRIRTITISENEGIKALYCGEDKVVITYLFARDKGWDMEKARAWIKEHKSVNVEHEISQNEILDELDYLKLMLEENGANEKVKASLQGIADKYLDKSIKEDAKPECDNSDNKNNILELELINEIQKTNIGGK